jgi:hypothetical protein
MVEELIPALHVFGREPDAHLGLTHPRVQPPSELLVFTRVADKAGVKLNRPHGRHQRRDLNNECLGHAATRKEHFPSRRWISNGARSTYLPSVRRRPSPGRFPSTGLSLKYSTGLSRTGPVRNVSFRTSSLTSGPRPYGARRVRRRALSASGFTTRVTPSPNDFWRRACVRPTSRGCRATPRSR